MNMGISIAIIVKLIFVEFELICKVISFLTMIEFKFYLVIVFSIIASELQFYSPTTNSHHPKLGYLDEMKQHPHQAI